MYVNLEKFLQKPNQVTQAYPQVTVSLTDIIDKGLNWLFNRNLAQLLVIAVVAAELAPKTNYIYYSKPKPQGRKEFSESDKKTTRYHQWFRCDECHEFNPNLQFHHKDGQNWNNDISNCQGLCPNCHAKKHLKPKLF